MMFDFLLPTYVVAKWSDYNQDFTFLSTFNSHCVALPAADKFYFKLFAERALEKHLYDNRHWIRGHDLYEVLDYRDLGYEYDEARFTTKYTFG